jgi:hypothetical protein
MDGLKIGRHPYHMETPAQGNTFNPHYDNLHFAVLSPMGTMGSIVLTDII